MHPCLVKHRPTLLNIVRFNIPLTKMLSCISWALHIEANTVVAMLQIFIVLGKRPFDFVFCLNCFGSLLPSLVKRNIQGEKKVRQITPGCCYNRLIMARLGTSTITEQIVSQS